MLRYFGLLLLIALPAFGKEFPDAPTPAAGIPSMASFSHFAGAREAASEMATHKFFDRGNKIRLGILAGIVASDGISTQEIMQGGGLWREVNPLARPFVNQGAPGQFAASVLGYGFSVGTSYLLHKTGHHRLEKLMLDASIGIETEVVASNLIWSSIR